MAHRQAKYQVRRQGVADNVDVPTPWYLAPYLSKINCTYGDWLNFTQALYNGVNAVVTPYSGPAYDQARADFYVQFDIYPLMVVFCTTTDDVALAISFAAAHKLKVAPRSGRHCTAGFSVLEEGVCIDTSGIKGVVVNDSDPDNPYAVVGAGTIWDQVNRELERLNYHTTGGGCPTVGVAGYSMGGGYGFTARSFGLACDNVLEVEIVLASGQVVVANETQNSYLLTAFKGGMGGNFGTVTQITFRIYPLTTVYGCLIEYNINDAALVLNTYMSNFTNNPNTDKRVGIQAVLCHTEDNTGKLTPIVSIACIFVGPTADAQTALKPLLDLKYEKFTAYPDQKYSYINYHILDPIEGIIPTTIVSEYKMSRYIPRVLTQSELQRIIDWYLTTPGQYNICAFESYGGAISNPRWGPDSFVHRENMCDFFCDSFYQPGTPCDYNAAKNWAYNFLVKDPYQLFSPTSYQNYPHMDYPEWETAYFGDQSNGVYRFLQAVKAKVDPTCMFYYPQGVFPLPVSDPDVLKLPELETGQKSMLSKRRFIASSTPTLTSSYDEKKFKEETKPVEKTYNNEKQQPQPQPPQQKQQKEKRSSKIARAMKKAFRSVFMCCLDQELPRGVDATQIDDINNGEPYRATRPQKHYRQKRI